MLNELVNPKIEEVVKVSNYIIAKSIWLGIDFKPFSKQTNEHKAQPTQNISNVTLRFLIIELKTPMRAFQDLPALCHQGFLLQVLNKNQEKT